MTAANPSMGPLSHEQWVEVHLRHAELHLSFLVIEQDRECGEPGAAADRPRD
jgi:hypothetical protein